MGGLPTSSHTKRVPRTGTEEGMVPQPATVSCPDRPRHQRENTALNRKSPAIRGRLVQTTSSQSPTITPRRPAVSRKRPNLCEVERASAIPRLRITGARVACRPRWGWRSAIEHRLRSRKNAQHLTTFTNANGLQTFRRPGKNTCFLWKNGGDLAKLRCLAGGRRVSRCIIGQGD
jgi:hypothetical protein